MFTRLQQSGIDTLFGVPGDFNLQLLEQIKEVEGIRFEGNCNELNASYAADGYGRLRGMGAFLTTYGVGDLSSACGLAGACSEKVPVVMISGTPPLYVMNTHRTTHHSLADGNFDNIRESLRQYTCYDTRITQENAAAEIDNALLHCWREKKPVLIQVPSNISYLEIDVDGKPLQLTSIPSDEERLKSAVGRAAELLNAAEHPLLMADIDVARFQLSDIMMAITEKLKMPYTVFRSGKGSMPEDGHGFLGIYNGGLSPEKVTTHLDKADVLLVSAPGFIEAHELTAPRKANVRHIIYMADRCIQIDNDYYEAVAEKDFVCALSDALDERKGTTTLYNENAPAPVKPVSGKKLTQEYFWKRTSSFLQPDDIIAVENGCSLVAMINVRLPKGSSFVSQPIWGSIGYSLPALLGAMTAQPERRGILFIGDGSFQLTAQELSTLLRLHKKPVIFLLNNGGYTIERYIQGKKARYNDVADWLYALLPKVLAPSVDTYIGEISTEDELENILRDTEQTDKPVFVELCLDPLDAPEDIKKLGKATNALDYGPRGPKEK